MLNEDNVLTKRQSEIVDLLTQGYNDDQIAYKFNIKKTSVRWHVGNIKNALGYSNRIEMIHDHFKMLGQDIVELEQYKLDAIDLKVIRAFLISPEFNFMSQITGRAEATVKNDMFKIYQKTGATNRITLLYKLYGVGEE